MATDLSGFSRGVAEFGIIHFLQTIYESERILVPVVESHDGILLKVEGRQLLRDLPQRAARRSQAADRDAAHRAPLQRDERPEEHVLLGVGLGFGRVLRIGDADVFGDEVNSACILGETYAKGYEILVTQAVRERAGDEDRSSSRSSTSRPARRRVPRALFVEQRRRERALPPREVRNAHTASARGARAGPVRARCTMRTLGKRRR